MLVGYFTSKDGSTLSVTDIKAELTENFLDFCTKVDLSAG